MALSQNLYQKQTQRLVITQDLRQSIELLPLSNLELSERIQKEILENPLLEDAAEAAATPEMEQIAAREEVEDRKRDREESEGDDNWQSNWEANSYSNTNSYQRVDSEGSERKHQFLQNAVVSSESLADHLIWQLRLSSISEGELEAGEIIVSAIDERGFLVENIEDLFLNADIDLKVARSVLQKIYELDPIGCGAQDIRESLQIQARILKPEDRATELILSQYFTNLEHLDYRSIERDSGLSADEIETAIHFIRTLEPYPGTLYAGKQPDYIVPDVIVTEISGKAEIIINDDWMPPISINSEYRDMLKSAIKTDQDREYLQNKANSAQWLIKSVRQRRQTLYRVMQSILEFQADFFREGPGAIKPLTLRMVAEQVELHESTVSRITTNKYAQTRWGVFELKFFFSSSVRNSTGDGSRSARSIQDRIRHLVDEEDPEAPLSDQDIVDRLKEENVQIARRTVAKYRKVLSILPADRRKKLKKLNARTASRNN